MPQAPATYQEAGLTPRPADSALAEDAAFRRRAERSRPGAAPRTEFLGRGAGDRLSEDPAPGRDRRRHHDGTRLVPLPHHRCGPAARGAVPGVESLRRRGAGAVRPVSGATCVSSPRRRRGTATRDRVREAFSHLVISQPVLDQLGPAINAGHSMFVYGPPGNGKTVISQAIRKLLHGEIAIPHAIEVEGSIIRFFDPVNHEPIESTRRRRGAQPRHGAAPRPSLGAVPAADGHGRR